MIGGEAAECSALERRHVQDDARDPYALGWVVDWLYGDAVLPRMPLLPESKPSLLPRRPHSVPAHLHGEAPVRARSRRTGKPRRRARQLALL